MEDFYTDPYVKFEHTPVSNKEAFAKNSVGIDAGTEMPEATFTYSDSNSIFVSNLTGNDSTGDGTQATPYKTILKGINECTATQVYVIVLDYHIYAEDISAYSNAYFSGLYTATEADRQYSKYFDFERIATHANALYGVCLCLEDDKILIAWADNDDGDQGKFIIYNSDYSIYKSETEFGTIAALRLDGEVLSNGDFVLAYDGTFMIFDDTGTVVKAETTVNAAASTDQCAVGAFSGGGFVVAYKDTGDSNNGNFAIYDNTGTNLVAEDTFAAAHTTAISCKGLNNNTVVIAFSDADDGLKGKFVIMDLTGTLVVSSTEFRANTSIPQRQSIGLLSNDNFVISYLDSNSKTRICIYDENGNSVLSPTIIDDNSNGHSAVGVIDDYFIVLFGNSGDAFYFMQFENDGTEYLSIQTLHDNDITYPFVCVNSENDFFYCMNDSDDTDKLLWNKLTVSDLPKISHRVLGFTPTDSNSIFVSSCDSLPGTSGGDGSQLDPVDTLEAGIALCDGTHQAVVILDSETYNEDAFEFTGNFLGLYAYYGHSPEIKTIGIESLSLYTDLTSVVSAMSINSNGGTSKACIELEDGNFLILFYNTSTSYLQFAIYDNNGVIVKAATNIKTLATGFSCCRLTNGNIVLVYNQVGSNGYFIIVDPDGATVVSETTFESGDTLGEFSCTGISGNEFAVCYPNITDNQNKMIIFDEDGNIEHGPVVVGTLGNNIRCDTLSNGNIVMVWDVYVAAAPNSWVFAIFDNGGNSVKAETTIETGNYYYRPDVTSLDGKFVTACYKLVVGPTHTVEFAIYNNDGTASVAVTTLDSGNQVEGISLSTLNNDAWVISYAKHVSSNMFAVYNSSGTQRVAPSVIEAGSAPNWSYAKICDNCVLINGTVVLFYSLSTDDRLLIKYPYSEIGIKISEVSTLNGLNLNADDDYLLNYNLYVNSAKPTIKWCDIKNCTNQSIDSGVLTAIAIYGDNETDIYNTKIYSNDKAIELTANDVIISDSQFYWNDVDYAIDIDGAAAGSGDITIEHCDIFNNYGGIRLQNNNGTNEILKNNIIYDNDNYGIYADTTITHTYSIFVGTSSGATAGTSTIQFNPLYINDGAVTPSAIDLNIKTRIAGYNADSPAKDLADDSRNAGAYDVDYIGSITTWTSITIDKPFDVRVWYEPVAGTKNISSDGTISYYKTGQTENVLLAYEAMIRSDFESVIAMWASSESQIRFYPDPVTSPNTYNVYTLEREKLNGSSKMFELSETGIENVDIRFSRKYEAT